MFINSLPESIGILHQLKLPSKLLCLIDNSNLISHRSTISTSTSSSSISVEPTTSTHQSSPTQDNDIQNQGDITLFEWITAQVRSNSSLNHSQKNTSIHFS